MIMDSNEEIERILERMDQRADEASKETVALLKQMAKAMAAMSEDAKKSLSEDTKHRRQERMRDDARSRREQSGNKSGGASKTGEALKNSMGKAGKAVDSFAGMLTITTDSLHDMVGVLKMFPVVGGLVATALGTLVVGGIQNTIDSFRQLNKHGIVFGDSIFDVNVAAVEAGMSIKEFSDTVSKYGVVINTYGIDAVMGFNKSLAASDSHLRKLGLTTRDITEFTMDYLDISRNLGERRVLDDMKTRKEAEEFADTLANMSRQTGTSIDELRKSILGQTKDSGMVLALGDKSSSQKTEINAFLAANPWAKQMIQDLLTVGASADLEIFRSYMGPFATSVEELVFGNGKAEDAITALGTSAKGVDEGNLAIIAKAGETNAQFKTLGEGIAAGIAVTDANNIKMADANRKRQELLDRTTKIDQMVQNLRNATFLPFLQSLENFEANVNMEALEASLGKLGKAVGDMVTNTFTPENVEIMATWVNGLSEAVSGIINFFNNVFGQWGLVGMALAFAFGPKLAATLISVVVKGLGGLLATGAAAAGTGLAAGGRGLLGAIGGAGKSVGLGFLTKLGGLGIGSLLATAVGLAMEKELTGASVGSAVGTGAGSFIGGFLGSFFGPLGTLAGMTLGGFVGSMLGGALGEAMYAEKEGFVSEAKEKLKAELAATQSELEAAKSELADTADPTKIGTLKEKIGALEETTKTISDAIVNDPETKKYEDVKWALGGMLNNLTMETMLREANLSRDEYANYNDAFQSYIREPTLDKAKNIQDVMEQLSGRGSEQASFILDNMREQGLLYANGGIANQPSIFGEAGAEAAIPLDSGMRIPIAEVSLEGMQEIQQMAQNNTLMVSTLNDVKQSLDRFLKFMQTNNRSAEELDVMLGMYAKLDDIAGSSQTMVRNFRSVF